VAREGNISSPNVESAAGRGGRTWEDEERAAEHDGTCVVCDVRVLARRREHDARHARTRELSRRLAGDDPARDGREAAKTEELRQEKNVSMRSSLYTARGDEGDAHSLRRRA